MRKDDEGLIPGEEKLVPEWSVSADDQIVALGLLLVAAFLAVVGWNAFTGDDTDANVDTADVIAAPIAAGDPDLPALNSAAPVTTINDGDDDLAATTPSTTTVSSTTAAPLDLAPDVATAVASFESAASTVTGSTAILTGFVGTDADKATAGAAAAAVPGITAVDNQLVAVGPGILSALEASGVAGAAVEMDGTMATVRGEVPDEPARTVALDTALAVPGVTAVVDELTVPAPEVTIQELNALFELEPIQFASGSAEILAASFGTLDQAAAVLADNDAAIDVQGYTDVSGPELTNLTLSQARADAVLEYLVGKGVVAENLTSTGYGETTEFGEGDSAEALAKNRRVRFELI